MKFRFASSDKVYELPTQTSTIAQSEFMTLLYNFLFKGEEPKCSFDIINKKDTQVFDCEKDIAVIKKGYAKVFEQPTKIEMTKKETKIPKRRWKSRSPVSKRKRRRRWKSPPMKQDRWY